MAANIILNRSVQRVSRFLMDTVMTTFKDRGAFTRTTSRWNGEPEQPRLLRPTRPGKLRSKCLLLKTRGHILCAFHTLHPATPLRNGPCTYKAGSSHDSQARHSKSAGELHFRNTGDEHTDQGWTLLDAFGLSCSHLSTICRFCITTVPHPGFLPNATRRG